MAPRRLNGGRTEKRKAIHDSDIALAKGVSDSRPVGRKGETASQLEHTRERSDIGEDSSEDGSEDSSEDDTGPRASAAAAYTALLASLNGGKTPGSPPQKRRKITASRSQEISNGHKAGQSVHHRASTSELADERDDEEGDAPEDASPSALDGGNEISSTAEDQESEGDSDEYEQNGDDPYTIHFLRPTNSELSNQVREVEKKQWQTKTAESGGFKKIFFELLSAGRLALFKHRGDLPIKRRLKNSDLGGEASEPSEASPVMSAMFNYQDVVCAEHPDLPAFHLQALTSLHILNHMLKGRDRVLRNNERIAKAGDDLPADADVQDQGFTRPKALILLETRQQCFRWINSLLQIFQPEQRENWSRFQESFYAEDHLPEHLPQDYKALFEGNSDNDFRLGIKLTRKTVKFFSAFYASDILLCSPLGLRRIIASSDPKKRDHDFLSSIEIAVLDQADAMQQQNWSHVDFAMSHLNLPPKDLHGADLTRIRPFYLDNYARNLRQTLIYASHITPQINALFNSLTNIAGRLKLTPLYPGVLTSPAHPHIKQTFHRFSSPTPTADPDARFTHFTSALLPSITKLASLSSRDTPAGILLFIPSYLDFVRVRNHFASSTQTENLSFGQLSEYTPDPESRRARSHFSSGRYPVLLYSGRAHHFHRLSIRGTKRVVWYGLPDNERFYAEVLGWIGRGVEDGRTKEAEAGSRALFGRWDGLALERVVGSERVGGMLREREGDTFEFL